MDEPFIYIASYRVRPELLGAAPERMRELTELVERQEPQLQSFHFYLDEAGGRVICVQVHPDQQSMATHMRVIGEHLSTAWDWLDPAGADQKVLGVPPQALTDYARQLDEELDSYPTFVAGFVRTAAPSVA